VLTNELACFLPRTDFAQASVNTKLLPGKFLALHYALFRRGVQSHSSSFLDDWEPGSLAPRKTPPMLVATFALPQALLQAPLPSPLPFFQGKKNVPPAIVLSALQQIEFPARKSAEPKNSSIRLYFSAGSARTSLRDALSLATSSLLFLQRVKGPPILNEPLSQADPRSFRPALNVHRMPPPQSAESIPPLCRARRIHAAVRHFPST